MPTKEKSLYESAAGKLRVSRMGPLTILVVDGQGLALCLTADFSPVEKWAKTKTAGPNATIDSTKILDKIDVMVCRAGTTFGSTRGSTKPLEAIVKAIRAAGMDPKEFSLPPELKDAKPMDAVAEAKAAKEQKDAAEAKRLGLPPPEPPGKGGPKPEPRPAEPAAPDAGPADTTFKPVPTDYEALE